jgi:hypothetical protein
MKRRPVSQRPGAFVIESHRRDTWKANYFFMALAELENSLSGLHAAQAIRRKRKTLGF